MDWEITHRDPRVASAFAAYRDFVLGVATHYAGSRLMEQLDLSPLGDDLRLSISDDFPDGLTTIRSVRDLRNSIETGEYGQLCLRLAIVQLCTAFEVFFDAVADIHGIPASRGDSVSATCHRVSASPLVLGNRAIVQIRKLHRRLAIRSVLDNDEVLVKLTAIIEVRNCIVHSAAVVADDRTALRLRAYAIDHAVGEMLHLADNLLDDFLHYMGPD